MSEKLVTGLITAIATLLVCLINNYFQQKRDAKTREEKASQQLVALQNTYTEQILEIKNDYSEQITAMRTDSEERHRALKDSIKDLASTFRSTADIITLKIDTLEQKQEKYNHLQERTSRLETQNEVQSEKIAHIEKALGGV